MLKDLSDVVSFQQKTLEDLKRKVHECWASSSDSSVVNQVQKPPGIHYDGQFPGMTLNLSDAIESQQKTIDDLKMQISECRRCWEKQRRAVNHAQNSEDINDAESRGNDKNLPQSNNLATVVGLQQKTIADLQRQITEYKKCLERNGNQIHVINQVQKHQGVDCGEGQFHEDNHAFPSATLDKPQHLQSDLNPCERTTAERGFATGFAKGYELNYFISAAEKDQLQFCGFANKNEKINFSSKQKANIEDTIECLEDGEDQFESSDQTSESSASDLLLYNSSSSIPPSLPELESAVNYRLGSTQTRDFTRDAAIDKGKMMEECYEKGYKRGFARGFEQAFN